MPASRLIDVIRLEVDAADLTNQIANHSGQLNGTAGWSANTGVTLASVANPTRTYNSATQTLAGTFETRAIRATITTAAGSNGWMRGPAFPVAPGQWVGFQASFADSRAVQASTKLAPQLGVEFLDSGGTVVATSDVTYFTLGRWSSQPVDNPWTVAASSVRAPVQVPAGVTQARLKFAFSDLTVATDAPTVPQNQPNNGWGGYVNRAVYITKLMAVTAARAEAVTSVPFGTEVWQNILGSSTSAALNRGGDVQGVTDQLDAGLMSVTVIDAELDPMRNPRMRPGRRVRLSATADGGVTWDPLMTARISNVRSDYSGLKRPGSKPRILITASDDVALLRNSPQPYNYSGTYAQKIRALMADVALAYQTDAGSASTTVVSTDPGATVWDQIERARNSFVNAKAYVDKGGVLQARTAAVTTPAASFGDLIDYPLINQVLNPSFEDTSKPMPAISFGGVTWTYDGTWSAIGARSLRATITSTPVNGMANVVEAEVPTEWVQGYYHSATVTVSAVRACLVKVVYYGQSGLPLYLQTAQLAAGAVREFTMADEIGANTETLRMVVQFWTPTDTQWTTTGVVGRIDRWCFYSSPIPAGAVRYFDGAQAGSTWVGDANYSRSRTTYRPTGAASYHEIEAEYGSKSIVNRLMLTRTNNTENDGEKTYGPYLNAGSVNTWGTISADVQVADGDPDTLARDLLGKYADASVFPSSIRIDALHPDCWAIRAAWFELYTGLRVILTAGGLFRTVLIIGIEHDITPDGWWVVFRFRPADISQTVTVTNQSGAGKGPDDVVPPPAGVFASRAVTVGQDILNDQWTALDLATADAMDGGVTYDATARAISIPRTGRYQLNAAARFNTNSTGNRQIRIVRNGAAVALSIQNPATGSTSISLSRLVRLNAGDLIYTQVYQNSGGTLGIITTASRYTYIDLTYVGD